ncbi:MAG: helix-turn-helix transcriptional regulator [Rhizobiaceae bacterium]|nr:helix-turn-helix transcriptional regulator [Parvibaculum sp.]MBX3566790.1 helix-turn-helix transcriptional regulator [Rhizobiaceae bacterium]
MKKKPLSAFTQRDHRNLFGANARDGAGDPAASIPEAVQRCRWIAIDIGAAEFGLFFVSPSLERARLLSSFDSSFPRVSTAAKFISGQNGEALVKHTRVSTTPCWWADADTSAAAARFAAHEFVQRIDELVPGSPGIAFPVFADRGQCGLVVFLGHDIAIEAEQILDIHARCFWLFNAVSRLSVSHAEKAPTMSKRELECLKLTAKGHTSDSIATSLRISVHTANQYLTNSTQKLNAVNRMHAVAKAIKLGLID